MAFSFMWPHPARRRWLKGKQWAREVANLAACALIACGFLAALIYRNL
jgi:hypothetical protein